MKSCEKTRKIVFYLDYWPQKNEEVERLIDLLRGDIIIELFDTTAYSQVFLAPKPHPDSK